MGNMLASGIAALLFKIGFYKKNAKVILLGTRFDGAVSVTNWQNARAATVCSRLSL